MEPGEAAKLLLGPGAQMYKNKIGKFLYSTKPSFFKQGGGPDGLFQLRWPASVADVSLRGDWTKIPSQYTWFRKVFLD